MKWGKTIVLLHLMLMCYSFSSILSKFAASHPFFSPKFCLCYCGIIVILGIYALAWQQIIKRLPLTTAYANKAMTVVWGLIWGALIFHETTTPGKITGAALVVAGVILFSIADGEVEER